MRYETRSKVQPAEVLRQARAYFGESYGLTATIELPESIRWEGGGGEVSLTVRNERGESLVELVTQEWDEPVREFMRMIGGHA